MSCPFRVSDKVVSIASFDDKDPTFMCPEGCPIKDHVYMVERADMGDTQDGLKLVGLTVYIVALNVEVGWAHRAFRKLEEIQAENRARREQEANA